MGPRSSFARLTGLAISFILRRVFHRGGAQLPGRVALALQPNLLKDLADKLAVGSIVVCGTNGKTTTNNVLAAAVEASGARVLCNREGANMAAGVTCAMLPGSGADWAIMEADELSSIHILPALRPRFLVLLNLFRDQLDRAGEIDHIQDTIVAALAASPETTLVACGDDPLCMGVARRARLAGTRVLTFGIGEDLGLPAERVAEARFCQVCGAELAYDYRTYAQLGAFRCPTGDFSRPNLDFQATGVHVDRTGVSFNVTVRPGIASEMCSSARITASFGGVYMVYNMLAAYAAASLIGVDTACFQGVLDTYHPANGRLQHFDVGGREVILNLAKNPTGFNQNISLLLADERPKAAFVVINDDFNDGKDISWIWDMDLERLVADEGIRVFCGGSRANDVQVRTKYAGLAGELADDVSSVLAALNTAFPVPNDALFDKSLPADASGSVSGGSTLPADASGSVSDGGTLPADASGSVSDGSTLPADAPQSTLPADAPLYVLCNYSALWPAKAELERIGRML